jgi:hypothetical protein
MSKKAGKTGNKKPLKESYQRRSEKGYQPVRGHLDSSNPPKGGSGVPPKSSKENRGNK